MIEHAVGSLKRTVAFRLSPGEDLLGGIQAVCEHYGIKSGVLLSGIGSLRSARFFTPVVLPGTKAGYGYSTPVEEAGPIELISVSGIIGEGENGAPLLHVHCCFADGTGRTFSGHLIEGNEVLMTADLVIGELYGIFMDRRYDPELDVYLVHPTQR